MKTEVKQLPRTLAAAGAMLLLWAGGAGVRADTGYDTLTGLRLGADVGPGAGIKYLRQVDNELFKSDVKASAQLDLTAHYVFSNVVGVGGHLGAALVPLDDRALKGEVAAFDVGPSLLLRLPLGRTELTLRMPFGLTLAGGSTREAQASVLGVTLGELSTSNELGVGFHAAALLGVYHWLSERLALRFETGPLYRTYRRDETFASYAGSAVVEHSREEVRHGLITWAFTVGVHFRTFGRVSERSGGP